MSPIQAHAGQLPSNQKFGWVFACIFGLGGAYAIYQSNIGWATGLFALAMLFALAAVVVPTVLAPLNRLWFRLGILLGRIISPIVLGIMFFLLITPVAVVARLCGRDALRIKRRRVTTYWVDREPKGPAPESFKNQF